MIVKEKLEYPFKTKPYQHQLTCWRKSKDEEAFALFMEMGTGKSKVLIDTIAYQYDKGMIDSALIVAPKGCYADFVDEHIPIHMPEHVRYKTAYWTSVPRKKEQEMLDDIMRPGEDLKILVMNVEAFTTKRGTAFAERFLCSHRSMMAIDESTSIKHLTSARTKNILKLRKMTKTRRIMTGDPTANSPLDIYSQVMFLDPHLLGFESFYTFKARYANLVRMNMGGRTFFQVAGYRDLDDLAESIKSFSFIVKKTECLDLPEKVYQKRRVDMGPKQREAYEQMRANSIVVIENEIEKRESRMSAAEQIDLFAEMLNKPKPTCTTCGRTENLVCSDAFHLQVPNVLESESPNVRMSTADLVIVQLQKLSQIACGFLKTDDGSIVEFPDCPRMDALVELLNELPKAVIWTNYRWNIFQIEKRLKKEFGEGSVVTYFGDTTQDERKEAKTQFRDLESGVRFFLANPATARFGLTLTEASTAIYYSNSYDREERSQSEDRIHRIGQTKKANIVDIVVPKTTDEKILTCLLNKQKISEQITKSNWRQWLE